MRSSGIVTTLRKRHTRRTIRTDPRAHSARLPSSLCRSGSATAHGPVLSGRSVNSGSDVHVSAGFCRQFWGLRAPTRGPMRISERGRAETPFPSVFYRRRCCLPAQASHKASIAPCPRDNIGAQRMASSLSCLVTGISSPLDELLDVWKDVSLWRQRHDHDQRIHRASPHVSSTKASTISDTSSCPTLSVRRFATGPFPRARLAAVFHGCQSRATAAQRLAASRARCRPQRKE